VGAEGYGYILHSVCYAATIGNTLPPPTSPHTRQHYCCPTHQDSNTSQ